ncbi:MAG: cell division protein FtsX [Candidatus Saccharibacteria bacterium]|nr:cell division protein FtsX [Candidatus Saccharibacteria bacterium]
MTTKGKGRPFSLKKQHRRRIISASRIIRYGLNNFSRNAWLTIAATAIMTITLSIVFTTVVARNILVSKVEDIQKSVGVSIYLKTETTQADVDQIATDIKKLSSVQDITILTPEEGRDKLIDTEKANSDTLEAAKLATNKIPWTINIEVSDINKTDQLREFVQTNGAVKNNIDPNNKPTFVGEQRVIIETIGKWVLAAQQGGIIASLIFVIISMLIIFNTIRMAIFNRREEIQMMKLIGAEKSFIRGPFLVEATVYGILAAIIASILGYLMLRAVGPALQEFLTIDPATSLSFFYKYAALIVLGMIVLGAIIGIISSTLATRRYLKL